MESNTTRPLNVTCTSDRDDGSALFAFVIDTVIVGLVIIIGVVGNILSIATFCTLGKHRSTTSVILTALAVSDSLYLLVHALLFQCLRSIYPQTGAFKEYDDVSNLIFSFEYPFGVIFQNLSIWYVSLVALDRYIAICWPLLGGRLRTFNKMYVYIGVLAAVAVGINFPRFFTTIAVPEFDVCSNATVYKPVYTEFSRNPVYKWVGTVVYLSFVYLAPIVFLIFVTARLVREFHVIERKRMKVSTVINEDVAAKRKSDVNKNTVMLCVIIVVFVICQLPQSVDHVLYTIPIKMTYPQQHYYDILCNAMVAINSSVNFFIYVLFGRVFRERLVEMLRLKRKTKICDANNETTQTTHL